jgi:hypothetical protein
MEAIELATRLLDPARRVHSPPSQNRSQYLGLAEILRREGRTDLAEQLVEAVKPPAPPWGAGTFG